MKHCTGSLAPSQLDWLAREIRGFSQATPYRSADLLRRASESPAGEPPSIDRKLVEAHARATTRTAMPRFRKPRRRSVRR